LHQTLPRRLQLFLFPRESTCCLSKLSGRSFSFKIISLSSKLRCNQ
jgi:hypothetical protein